MDSRSEGAEAAQRQRADLHCGESPTGTSTLNADDTEAMRSTRPAMRKRLSPDQRSHRCCKRNGRYRGSGKQPRQPAGSVAGIAILGLLLLWSRACDAATCDTTCSCSAFDLMGQCTNPTPACGFTPCTGGPECPSGPPQSLTAFVTGPGTLALNWTDPADLTMVDQYNIYYSMSQGRASCAGKATRSACSFVPPPGSTLVTGECGPNAEGVQYCWLDFSRYILAVPPCVLSVPQNEDTSCNFQEVNTGIIIGTTYQYKVDAGRCCYGDPNILGTPGCGACTAFDAFATCPKSDTYAFASITGQQFPTAVQDLGVRVDGDRALYINWSTPEDTGTLQQVPEDILAYVVTRSTRVDFSENIVETTLAGSEYSFRDSDLTPNVHYYYRVQPRNMACGQLDACGGTSFTNLTAVGVPSMPINLTLVYLVGRPNVIRADWATPTDTGLGDGSLNQEQLLYRYTLHINGVYHALLGSELNTTFIAVGLTSGTLYTFTVTATNIAGTGPGNSASKIAAGLPLEVAAFSSSVNPTDGELKIRLTWSAPLNSGRGDQEEPITGYKILMDSSTALGADPTFVGSTVVYETTCAQTSECATTFVASFAAARKAPYYFRIYARNFIGYSEINDYEQASEQSVALPSKPLTASAAVTSPNSIQLYWTIPADTGVGDKSRELLSYRIMRAYGAADMACTTTCSSCDACSWSQIGACCSLENIPDYDNRETTMDWSIQPLPQSETRFYLRLLAVNDAGEGAWSDIVSEQGVQKPSAVTGLTTSIPSLLSITVQWALPEDTGVGEACSAECRPITGYRLKIQAASGLQLLDESKLPSVTTHTISGLSHLTTYTFTVFASNDAGETSNALAASIIEQPVNYPTVPTFFSASIKPNSPYTVDLSWDTPQDTGRKGLTNTDTISIDQSEPILSYLLEVDTSVNSDFGAGNVLVLCDGLTTVCTGLTCVCAAKSASVTFLERRYEEYHFRVQAENQVGYGGYSFSNEQSVGWPSAVPSVNTSVTGIRQISLVWMRPLDTGVGVDYTRPLLQYVLQRSYGDANFGQCAYGTNALDDCAASTFGACCTESGISENTLATMKVMPSIGPTYFFFRVLGQNEVGFGPESARPGKEQGVGPPGPISSLDVQTIGPAQFSIAWTQVTNSGLGVNNTERPLNSFKLQICQDPVRDFSILYFEQDFLPTEFEFSKYDFIGGRNYTFRIFAFNDAGRGDPSMYVTKPAISLPSEPRGFRAAVFVPLQINLYWEFPLDTGFGDATTAPLLNYILNISTSESFSAFQEVVLDPRALAWNHTGLTKGTIYYYRIRSQTDAGLSVNAPNASEMAISVPGIARNFSVLVDSPLVIRVSWAVPEDTGMGASSLTPRGLVGYELRIADSNASEPLSDGNLSTSTSFRVIATAPSVTNYDLTGLQKGLRYYFQVIAINSAGKSPPTEYLRDRGITEPSPATGVRASVTGPFSIFVVWNINNDSGLGPGLLPDQLLASGGIRLDISANLSNFANATQLYLTGSDSSYLFTGLVKGVKYFFRLFSINRAGSSVSSAVTTERAIDVPSVPRSFAVQTSTVIELQLDLAWLLPSDTGAGDQSNLINYYKLQESTGQEPNASTPNTTVAGSSLLLHLANRTKGLVFFYRLIALNDAGESPATPVVSEMAIERPTQPLNLTVDWYGPMRLFLSWRGPTDTGNGHNHESPRELIAFDLDIDDTSSAFADIVSSISFAPSAFNYTLTEPNISQGTKYYFRIRTNNSAGYSPSSNTDSKTAINLPTAPRNLEAQVTSPLEITLTWEMPANTGGIGQDWALLNYSLYMAHDENHTAEVLVLQDIANSYVQVELTKAQRYFFRIFALNQVGASPASNSASEEGVELPTMPTAFSLTVPGELQLSLTWQLPADTGTGGHNRPLLRYILEVDHVLLSNGSFSASPYALHENTTCYTKATTPCDPAQYNAMALAGVNRNTQRLFSDLQWGNTYFFRIFAVNSAGMGKAAAVINEQALVLPSKPLKLFNNLLSQLGQPIFVLTWESPLESGAGNIRRFQDPTGAVTGNVRPIDNYLSQAAPVPPGETSVSADFDHPDNLVALSPETTSVVETIKIGFVYFFRVAAVNRVGRGPFGDIATSGPEVDEFVPHRGPALGAFHVTVFGNRFGTSVVNIEMKIGETKCPTIRLVEDDKAFICVAPPGTGGTHDVIVSIAQIPVTKQRQFIYEAPSITAIIPAQISSAPSQVITLLGRHFGAKDMTPVAVIAGAPGALAPCVSSVWVADSSITCLTPEVSEFAVDRNGVQVVVDGIRNSLLQESPHFVYTDLPSFYAQCLREQSEECFDCVVSSCYQVETAKAASAGAVASDALDLCESTAASFCRLSDPI